MPWLRAEGGLSTKPSVLKAILLHSAVVCCKASLVTAVEPLDPAEAAVLEGCHAARASALTTLLATSSPDNTHCCLAVTVAVDLGPLQLLVTLLSVLRGMPNCSEVNFGLVYPFRTMIFKDITV